MNLGSELVGNVWPSSGQWTSENTDEIRGEDVILREHISKGEDKYAKFWLGEYPVQEEVRYIIIWVM